MSDGFSLVKIDGKITEPATVLINKISGAIGGGFKPRQIRRVAEAEADAAVIKANAQIEIREIKQRAQRALTRFVMEESKKQDNIESITEKAIKQLNPSSAPQDIEDDWITNFFDKCRIISDEDMQVLWARILAGEANSPGTYSKRTINFLGSLDKTDAELFLKLCSFTCLVDGIFVPFVYHEDFNLPQSLFKKHGLIFDNVLHLTSIGLISFEVMGYVQTDLPQQTEISYHKTNLRLEFGKPQDNDISNGNVLLTTIGKQMAQVCDSKEVDGFIDYVISKLSQDKSIVISSPYPRQDT